MIFKKQMQQFEKARKKQMNLARKFLKYVSNALIKKK